MSSKKITNMALDIFDNRVFDLYLKFMGITLLTPQTLVPLALVLGGKYVSDLGKIVKQRRKQKGGSIKDKEKYFKQLEKHIPIVDDSFGGNYLKLMALTSSAISPYTLIPLAVAIGINNLLDESEKKPRGRRSSKSKSRRGSKSKSRKSPSKGGRKPQKGGSDYIAHLNARGPYNYPDQGWYDNECMFKQFNQSSPYIKNSDLLNSDLLN